MLHDKKPQERSSTSARWNFFLYIDKLTYASCPCGIFGQPDKEKYQAKLQDICSEAEKELNKTQFKYLTDYHKYLLQNISKNFFYHQSLSARDRLELLFRIQHDEDALKVGFEALNYLQVRRAGDFKNLPKDSKNKFHQDLLQYYKDKQLHEFIACCLFIFAIVITSIPPAMIVVAAIMGGQLGLMAFIGMMSSAPLIATMIFAIPFFWFYFTDEYNRSAQIRDINAYKKFYSNMSNDLHIELVEKCCVAKVMEREY